jgi:hypothetical protein
MKKNHLQFLGFVLLTLLMLGVRFNFYEPLDRSVSGHDTERYTVFLDTPDFWSDLFTSNRQTTTTLFYKLLESAGGYEVTNLSSPGDFVQPSLVVQPGFDHITAVQSWLAIVAWVSLAFVVFRNLQNPVFKFLGAFLVLLFGFAPQMAQWDYVMLTEPVSMSLFVLLLALSVELVVLAARENNSPSASTYVVLFLWLLVAVMWVFTRDTNAYMVLVILAAMAILALITPIRERLPIRPFLVLAVLLMLLFLGANFSLQRSGRWVNPFFNNFITHILPNPDYLAFFEEKGLPVTDEVRALKGTSLSSLAYFEIDYLVAWVEEHGSTAYMEFLITHPGWALQTVLANSEAAFGESTQPFFERNPDITPDSLFYFGRLMHPVNTSLIFIAAAQIALFAFLALKRKDASKKAMAGLFLVFLLGEIFMFAISILGDAGGIVRHTMGAVMPMRLSLWLLPPFILDSVFSQQEAPKKVRKAPHGRMPKKKRS